MVTVNERLTLPGKCECLFAVHVVQAFLYSPVFHLDRGELIFGFNIYPADRIDKPLNGGEVDLDIIVYFCIKQLLQGPDRSLHSVKTGMSKFIHRIVEVRHVYLIVTRYGSHKYLLGLRIYRHHHVDIAPAFFIYRTVNVYTGYDEIERVLCHIRHSAFILYGTAAQE